MKQIWVAGYPSFCGGADTELDHQIDLWIAKGVEVHLVPLFSCNAEMQNKCNQRGCITHHDYNAKIFKGKTVVSYCNGDFLKQLPDIYERGKPEKVIWINCMTWTFSAEEKAVVNDYITYHVYHATYQRNSIIPKLERKTGKMIVEPPLPYIPYYSLKNSAGIEHQYKRPSDYFGVGRISRDDGNKYNSDLWVMHSKVSAPRPVKHFVLGWGANAKKKCGDPLPQLDYLLWGQNGIKSGEFYKKIHCLLHKTGGSRENYPRVLLEAWHSGVVPIMENQYSLPDLIQDGVTGYLCNTSDEFAFRASELAFNEKKRKEMVDAGYKHLLENQADKDKCWKFWDKLL